MRLDLFLKQSRIVSRRPVAQELCEAGAVLLNGSPVKSAHNVKLGDRLSIRYKGRVTSIIITNIPARPPSKAEASRLYEVISVEFYETDWRQ